jgi:hypothetical protein
MALTKTKLATHEKNSNQNVILQIRIETFQVLEWKCESPQNRVANQNSEISLLELLSQLLNEFSKLA